MAQFAVTITYQPLHPPQEGDDLSLFDPPANPDQPHDDERVYKTLVNARSESQAFEKVLASRREVDVSKRIYPETVCDRSIRKIR